jgi:hypothetical protein
MRETHEDPFVRTVRTLQFANSTRESVPDVVHEHKGGGSPPIHTSVSCPCIAQAVRDGHGGDRIDESRLEYTERLARLRSNCLPCVEPIRAELRMWDIELNECLQQARRYGREDERNN